MNQTRFIGALMWDDAAQCRFGWYDFPAIQWQASKCGVRGMSRQSSWSGTKTNSVNVSMSETRSRDEQDAELEASAQETGKFLKFLFGLGPEPPDRPVKGHPGHSYPTNIQRQRRKKRAQNPC